MSKYVVISESLSTGFAVTGPFPNWGTAYQHANSRSAEIFELREPATPTEGDSVLLIGDPLAGHEAWGPFPFDTAANAASPFNNHTVNPDNRPCVVFRLTPPGESDA